MLDIFTTRYSRHKVLTACFSAATPPAAERRSGRPFAESKAAAAHLTHSRTAVSASVSGDDPSLPRAPDSPDGDPLAVRATLQPGAPFPAAPALNPGGQNSREHSAASTGAFYSPQVRDA